MIIRVQVGNFMLNPPYEAEGVDAIVVKDDEGTPVAILQQIADGTIVYLKATDKDFHTALTKLGIEKRPAQAVQL